MKRIFAVIYGLVLIVQVPHVASVYAALEHGGWYQWLGWFCAMAFDASIFVFTYRIVVERSTRRTTRAGLAFFLVASCVANATYYELAPALFAVAMPVFATVALPLSLALFASEFGAEVRREERRQRRIETSTLADNYRPIATDADSVNLDELPATEVHVCPVCGRSFDNRYALSAHMRVHRAKGENDEARRLLPD
jgi:hypothetical protein